MPRILAAAAATAVLVLTAACGTDEDAGGTATLDATPTGASAPTPTSVPLPAGVEDAIRGFVAEQSGNYVGDCGQWESRTPTEERPFCSYRAVPGTDEFRVSVGSVASDFVFNLVLQREGEEWVIVTSERATGT